MKEGEEEEREVSPREKVRERADSERYVNVMAQWLHHQSSFK